MAKEDVDNREIENDAIRDPPKIGDFLGYDLVPVDLGAFEEAPG